MSYFKLLPVLFAASSMIAVSNRADAQTRAVPRGGSATVGRAVARPAAPVARPGPFVGGQRFAAPYRPYYRSAFSFGFYAGYPFGYYPYAPYAYVPYGYYGYPAGYVVPAPTASYGSLRIQGAPGDAQVFADGYYAGIVDDFDGAYQHLNLQPGSHHIEIRVSGSAARRLRIT